MAKQVSPGVLALRKVVDDVYADAREAKKQGKLVGWSSSKFPCELAEAFDLNVMYPENQAAGIAAQRDGEIMCQAAEDLASTTISAVTHVSPWLTPPVSAPAASSTPKRSSSSSTPTAASPSRTKTARSSSILRPASPRRTPRRRSPTRFWTISTRSSSARDHREGDRLQELPPRGHQALQADAHPPAGLCPVLQQHLQLHDQVVREHRPYVTTFR